MEDNYTVDQTESEVGLPPSSHWRLREGGREGGREGREEGRERGRKLENGKCSVAGLNCALCT